MQHAPRAIVVGGGLAGLTAAALLADRGRRVEVLDAAPRLGGRAQSTRAGGAVLNLGPHALAERGPGTAVLARLGVEMPGARPDPRRARLMDSDRLVPLGSRRRGGPGLRGLAALARLRRLARTDPDGTVADLLDAAGGDERARLLLTALARLATYTDDPGRQHADVLAGQLREASQVRYLDDGWAALVDRLAARAASAGARLRPAAPARAVTVEDGQVTGVRTDHDELAADEVVLAVGGPETAARLVPEPAARRLVAWAERAQPVRMASLDAALSGRPDGPTLALGTAAPTYVAVHSDVAAVADPGAAAVHAGWWLPLDARAPSDARHRLEACMDVTLPGWRDRVEHVRYLPDLVVTHDGGAAITGGRRARPGPRIPEVDGLAVAGDWVGAEGHLAQASLASAASAVAAVTAEPSPATVAAP